MRKKDLLSIFYPQNVFFIVGGMRTFLCSPLPGGADEEAGEALLDGRHRGELDLTALHQKIFCTLKGVFTIYSYVDIGLRTTSTVRIFFPYFI